MYGVYEASSKKSVAETQKPVDSHNSDLLRSSAGRQMKPTAKLHLRNLPFLTARNRGDWDPSCRATVERCNMSMRHQLVLIFKARIASTRAEIATI